MKTTSLLTLVICAGSAFASNGFHSSNSSSSNNASDIGPRAVGGFAQSCPRWGGGYGNNNGRGFAVLSAVCNDGHGKEVMTFLDLQNCIANYGGNLACATKCVVTPSFLE